MRICPRCRRENVADATRCADCGSGIDHVAVSRRVDPAGAELAMKVDAHGVAQPIDCPVCGVPLHVGEAFIHLPYSRWRWSALLADLVVRLRGRHEAAPVLRYGENRLAARCPACAGVWIGPHPVRRR